MIRFFVFLGLVSFLSSCNAVSAVKVRDGKTAYDTKQYSVAVKLLRNEIRKADTRLERGRLSFMLAESYKALQQSDDAVDWYLSAYDNSYGVDALKEMAYMLKKAERYEEAIVAFRDLSIEIGSPYEYRKDITACELAKTWKEDPRKSYQTELTGFNSGKADYSPFFADVNTLIFTSDRASSTGDKTYTWTGNQFSDLFQVDLISGNVSPFSKDFNTDFNEGTLVMSADGSEAFFTRCFDGKKEDQYCKLMAAKWNGNNWSKPEVLPFVKPGQNYMHPAISSDGNTLYFTTNDPEGYGGYDIFRVSRNEAKRWETIAQPLSAAVNTNGNEQFPTFHKDTLYFSSNRHSSIGGLDIFKTYKMANGAWAPVINLKPPLNSGADDFGLLIAEGSTLPEGVLQKGFFSSNRLEGLGGDDIYSFEKRPLPPLPIPPVVETEPAKIILDVFVVEKIYDDPLNPNSKVLGRRPLEAAELTFNFGTESKTVSTDVEGRYELEIEGEYLYEFLAFKTDYLRNTGEFNAQGLKPDPNNRDQRYEIEIELDKIFFDTEIVLENIYYDLDKAFIRDDAKPTLDALIADLNLNPEINIELSSHTDCRGGGAYNLDLSQRRAQSAVDYLESKGISENRLTAKGYGKTLLKNDCVCTRCTEEEHQENRRTTFKVIQ